MNNARDFHAVTIVWDYIRIILRQYVAKYIQFQLGVQYFKAKRAHDIIQFNFNQTAARGKLMVNAGNKPKRDPLYLTM